MVWTILRRNNNGVLRGTQDFEVVGRRERVGVIKDDM